MLKAALIAMLVMLLCYAGSYLTGNSYIDRPIVIGAVAGLFLGNLKLGLTIGATLEAVFMGALNVGGVISSEPAIATVLAVTFAVTTNISQKAAVTLTIPIGVLAAFVLLALKNGVMIIFAPILDKLAATNNQKGLIFIHFLSWFIYYGIYAVMTFIGVYAGSSAISSLVKFIPQNLMAGLNTAGGLLPAVGFATLMKILWDNKLAVFYLLGFVLTIYLNLPAVAIACIGIAIVVVMAFRDKDILDLKKKKSAMTTKVNSSLDQKQQEEEDFFA
ncbi:PTS sugar transporter subunit IIC [Lactobacillus sp. ESL0731]|uniref:PTS mannose/fructose/sorbose/N-acetylgalactosamine transporter subunit IIC n=1 Tax=unclassified Lactobacillus TaxID=2620435 RepID=UPI0023F730BE|nr:MULTISPECIES: PTS sugar transporter subunit IIC [unclassified Lactobacillus]WEV51364.1 PTS sugar transporter subunit IIC [Lactobacillus sp. ESL0700]WEV62494.1 PTS sugar transporter subunit IIC [Lactobacillus sp. ESL0731]